MRGHGEIGKHNRLGILSALGEILGVESLKFGETLTGRADGNPEPSPLKREGVETLQATPNAS